jgi:hypothetical protein
MMGRACNTHRRGEKKSAYKVLVEGLEGKRSLGRPRLRFISKEQEIRMWTFTVQCDFR